MDLDFIINKFENTLELPGISAHSEVSLMERPLTHNQINSLLYRESSVMFFLYEKEGIPYTVAIERNQYEGAHSGQISLPGGKFEKTDSCLFDTALRESEEEIGVSRKNILKLKDLSTVFIPVSKFIVNPYVSILKEENPIFSPNAREVSKIIEIPIDQILEESSLQRKDISTGKGFVIKDAPYFRISDFVIWGATALIFNEVKHILKR